MASSANVLVLCTIFHFLGLTLYTYGIYFNNVYVDKRMKDYFDKMGLKNFRKDEYGLYKFLTMWNMIFQLTYYFICCVCDLITSSGAHSPFTRKVADLRDWFLAAVAFPIGTLVVTVFWTLWAIDRELIFPKALDAFFPSWLNHIMHTTVLPLLLLDMFLVRHRYPTRVTGVLGLCVVALSYLVWILWLGFVADIWVYPVLQVLSGASFASFIVVSALSLIVIYVIGEKASKTFWRGYADYDFEMEKLD